MMLQRSYLFLILMILSSSKDLLCDEKDQGSINLSIVASIVVGSALSYVVCVYGDRGVNKAYYWLSGEESPEKKMVRLEKEENEHKKRRELLLSSRALAVDESTRQRLLANGDISSEENEQILAQHKKRLFSNNKKQAQLDKLNDLKEKSREPSSLHATDNEDGSISLRMVSGKAR